MKEFDLWDPQNEIVQEVYKGENYCIWDRNGEGSDCLILFSGNGLFYPNKEEVFHDIVVRKDRYEYQNLARSDYLHRFTRIIFVRDIHKQWYVTGINEKCSDVVTTVALLRTKTDGDHVTTAGNSAGGYAAVLFGVLLRAERIFTFSGQWDITDAKYAPYVERYKADFNRSRFYDLRTVLQDREVTAKIYYFWPDENEKDKYQAGLVKDIPEIRAFEFRSKKHESTVLPFQIPYLLSMEEEELDRIYRKYCGKKIVAWKFLISSMGLLKGISEVFHYLQVKIKERRLKGK